MHDLGDQFIRCSRDIELVRGREKSAVVIFKTLMLVILMLLAIFLFTFRRHYSVFANIGLVTVMIVMVMSMIPTDANSSATQRLKKHECGQNYGLPLDEH